MNKELLKSQIAETLLKEARETFRVGSVFAPALFLAFWIVDLFYAPSMIWPFLGLRVMHAGFVAVLAFGFLRRARSIRAYQIGGTVWAAFAAGIITTMIFLTGGVDSSYYAGLSLVALLAIFYIPYSLPVQITALCLIYFPYIGVGLMLTRSGDIKTIALNSAFFTGTVLIGLSVRRIEFRMRCREVEAQVALALEVAIREQIIREKTGESAKLARLSNQFSPQVVEAIRTGGLELEVGAKRSEIASIFIDIVNSTNRVVRVDKDKVHKVISMFLEDTVRILLKYDLTIDKFMGDGILAFSNEPVHHSNYAERTVRAAIEIRERISLRQEEYENSWMNVLQIRVGVSSGYANVGFYGTDKLYKCYTAIGPVVNLACRLCSSAEPDQIIVSHDIMEKLPSGLFDVEFIGKKVLKGFEEDLIKCYEIKKYSTTSAKGVEASHSIDCPHCSEGTLFLDSNEAGQFVFRCRDCGHVETDATALLGNPDLKLTS